MEVGEIRRNEKCEHLMQPLYPIFGSRERMMVAVKVNKVKFDGEIKLSNGRLWSLIYLWWMSNYWQRRDPISLVWSVLTYTHTKTNEFLEKFQMAFDTPPHHFWKTILWISWQNYVISRQKCICSLWRYCYILYDATPPLELFRKLIRFGMGIRPQPKLRICQTNLR